MSGRPRVAGQRPTGRVVRRWSHYSHVFTYEDVTAVLALYPDFADAWADWNAEDQESGDRDV